MNVGVNTRLLLSDRPLEGIGRYTFEVMSRLVTNYPEHTFYFFFDRPYDEKYIFAKNVIPLVVGPPTRHPLLLYVWLEWLIPKYIRKHKIECFLSFDNFLSLKTRVPSYLICHDIAFAHFPQHFSFFQRKFYSKMMPKFLRHAKHIFAVSEYTKNDICLQFNIDAEKIDVANNALPGIFQGGIEINKNPERPYVIIPGSIHPRKNVYNILKAISIYNNQNKYNKIDILLAGRFMGKQEKELVLLIEDMKRQRILSHVQKLSESEMVMAIKGASALLYLSRFEGFGIPILEGFACGVPVITSNVTSMPEVAGDAACLADPENPESIVKALERIMKNSSYAESLILKGRERIKKFSWDQTAKIIGERIFKREK